MNMAYQLSILLRCSSEEEAQSYRSLLDRETRPIFEDEVESQHLAAFKVIDDIEYPSSSDLDGETLILIWYEEDGLQFEDVFPLTQLDGVELLAGYEIPDDPMSWDEDVDDGWFWLPVAQKTQQVSFLEGRERITEDIQEKLQVPM